eukprot:Clim_evm9s29 gene=Clim_evmTU9s29
MGKGHGSSTAKEPFVLYETQGHIGVFTLNRPSARNAINGDVSRQMEVAIDRFERDRNLRVGILRANGTTFCAGADLKAVNRGDPDIRTRYAGFGGLVFHPNRRKPIIACVDGPALAGGCEMALACDLIVASDRAQFGLPEVKRSLVAAAGGLFRLPRKIPENVAMELLLTGESISAAKGGSSGTADQQRPDANVFASAVELAQAIIANAPLAVAETRSYVSTGIEEHWTVRQHWTRSEQAFASMVGTPDFWEVTRAFIEKREPNWTGQPRDPATALAVNAYLAWSQSSVVEKVVLVGVPVLVAVAVAYVRMIQ